MFLRPFGVVGCARPTNQSRSCRNTEQRHDDHPERLAPDMWQGVERYLPAFERSRVTAPLRDQRMSGFMAGSGKQENDVLEKPKDQLVGIHGKRPSIADGVINDA